MSIDITRLNECTELNYILVGDLLDLLDEPVSDQTCHWLSAVLDSLLDTVPEEYLLKSDEGYLCEVLSSFPDWQPQIDRLEEQHVILIRQLRGLRRALESGVGIRRLVASIRPDLEQWIDAFRRHHQEERRLMQLAVNLEIGGSG